MAAQKGVSGYREATITPQEIPQQLIDILDARAGKLHSREGAVVACLAEILTAWEEIRQQQESSRKGM